MQQILKSYQRRLVNLSGNNRSLLLLRLNKEQFLDLHDFDHVNGLPSWNIVEQVIAKKSKIKLIPVSDPRDENSNALSNRLKRLKRREEFIFQETGAKDLYVGWPFVEGKFNDGTPLRAPLCFFPIRLTEEGNNWEISLKQDVNISFNKSLLLAFAHYNELELLDELVEFTFDGYERDSTQFKNMLYEQLRESPIALRFNREYYGEKLEPFSQQHKESFVYKQENGEISVQMQAVFGIFPQSDSYLVPDYDFLLQQSEALNLDDFFARKTINLPDRASAEFDPTKHFLNQADESETYTPFALDAYQENALNAVKKGNSIVVQGPPGTGKSQLICNLASDFIARGKKVLIVSQKRAALDVVHERLKSIGVQDFTALVHDFKSDRKAIYDQVANQIENTQQYAKSNSNLDALQLDRNFKKSSLTIEDISEELNEYKTALFDHSECGLSVKELYLTSDPEKENIALVQEYNGFHFDHLKDFTRNLDLYFDYAQRVNAADHPWSERVSFGDLTRADMKNILAYLSEIPHETKALTGAISEIIKESVDFDACRTISENLDKLKALRGYIKNQKVFELFRPMVQFGADNASLLWLKNTRNLINTCFEGEGVEHSIPAKEIGEVQLILKQRSDAKNSFLTSLKWRFSKEKLRLARILVANDLRDDKNALKILTARIDNRLNLQHQLTKLRGIGWIGSVPKTTDQQEINLWLDQMELAVQAKALFDSFANFKEFFPLKNSSAKIFKDKLQTIEETLKLLPEKRAEWNKYILPKQIDSLLQDSSFGMQLSESIKKDFDVLKALDELRDSFDQKALATIDKLFEQETKSKAALIALFDNSIRLAWIDHIENKYPILTSVSTLKFEKLIDEFQSTVSEKSEASAQILIQRAREKTYTDLEFNRLNNQVTYRDLLHQVSKKKRIWPIRRLISNFESELFNLVPCWLASPESVSAIFPMEPFFDLVIFDEASQCFAEKGIPAIFRGKQLVIAGDSQQLQPNDLYRVRWEDEQEEMALEIDSLLELATRHLMEIDLQGHYRSRSLSLIDFSNRHFYKGRLKVLPEFGRNNNPEPAIDYIKVNGIWEKQRNEAEANAVIYHVREFLKEHPNKSIGIVTFNAQQQTLILDTLEESGLDYPPDLFVKNIENVQGDERDIIIFSIGYAPDAKGKFNVQFGSLNQKGGENRLNVAVSRARDKVLIISSILPKDLKVDKTKNEGPKLLKTYLDYALEVSNGKFQPVIERESPFKQSWYLKHQIEEWAKDLAVDIETKSPFADVELSKNGQQIGLLFTDDNYFYESLSMKEVCVYRPDHLQEKKWPFRTVHSREFWINKEKIKDNLLKFVELNTPTD
ncbi:AAA domain-containing protein [Roseivirga sp.]|uniref:AAA domain-containing protein n=1 Tax=Roseivirga sp. TaxID=1964215 RepID=UPI003B8E9823